MLKKGDIIFIVDSAEKNISELSVGYADYSYYHCALYIGDNKIIEAVNHSGVIIANLDKYLSNTKLVARTTMSNDFLESVIEKSHQFLGYGYNNLFLLNQEKQLYCSELIHKAFNLAYNNTFFTQHELNYMCHKTSKISDFWQKLYAEHGLKVPHGQPGSHPNNLSLDDRFVERFFL